MDHHPTFKEMVHIEFKKIYNKKHLYFLIPLFILSAVGIVDSFFDGDGRRMVAFLPFLLPGVVSAVNTLSVLWKKDLGPTEAIFNFTFSAFFISLPLIIFNLIILIIFWLLPFSRELLETFDRHAWWRGSIIIQSLNIVLLGYFVQMLGLLIMMLVIVLPVLSIKNPNTVTLGSNLEFFNNENQRNWRAVCVYFGLSSFIIGFIISMESSPFEIIENAVLAVSHTGMMGTFEGVRFVIGALFLLTGIVLMLIPIILVIIIMTRNTMKK
ncbi:hypothetical protein [Corticicoccus populi]|uniref:Glycerophosphoryl diester phosphodiesterase membrane domain-containing protein n=1 Tax=Corticicoccus populi TaxID=1812821 RepID=A0ABW5WXF1_9STAP